MVFPPRCVPGAARPGSLGAPYSTRAPATPPPLPKFAAPSKNWRRRGDADRPARHWAAHMGTRHFPHYQGAPRRSPFVGNKKPPFPTKLSKAGREAGGPRRIDGQHLGATGACWPATHVLSEPTCGNFANKKNSRSRTRPTLKSAYGAIMLRSDWFALYPAAVEVLWTSIARKAPASTDVVGETLPKHSYPGKCWPFHMHAGCLKLKFGW